MSKVTITLEDNNGEIDVKVEFNPPIDRSAEQTGAQITALRVLDLLRNEELEDGE